MGKYAMLLGLLIRRVWDQTTHIRALKPDRMISS